MTTATKITLFRVVMIPVFLVCMYLSEIWSWMQIVSCGCWAYLENCPASTMLFICWSRYSRSLTMFY